MTTYRSTLLLWLLPTLAWSQGLLLTWDFPRSLDPPIDGFVLRYTAPGGQTLGEMQTPPSAVGACETGGRSTTEDTYCTAWPVCPAVGVMVFFVHAVRGEEVSPPSELVTCVFVQGEPCVCHPPDYVAPVPPGPRLPPVVLPPLPPGEIPPIQVVTVPEPPPFLPQFPPTPA